MQSVHRKSVHEQDPLHCMKNTARDTAEGGVRFDVSHIMLYIYTRIIMQDDQR